MCTSKGFIKNESHKDPPTRSPRILHLHTAPLLTARQTAVSSVPHSPSTFLARSINLAPSLSHPSCPLWHKPQPSEKMGGGGQSSQSFMGVKSFVRMHERTSQSQDTPVDLVRDSQQPQTKVYPWFFFLEINYRGVVVAFFDSTDFIKQSHPPLSPSLKSPWSLILT